MTMPSHLPRRRASAARTQHRGRLWLEQLEPRTLLSTLVVLNLNDSGAGSLRQAIQNASAGDSIIVEVSGQISLTSGPLSIFQDLTITGPGAANLTISGNNAFRVFTIGDVNVALSGLTVANGASASSGGAILMNGDPSKTLSLSECVFTNDHTVGAGNGGAVSITGDGTLSVNGCTFMNCSAPFNGGAIDSPGIFLNVSNSTFSGNSASNGGAVSIGNDSVSFTNCTFFGNAAAANGGAIVSVFNADYTLLNCTVAGNFAGTGGGLSLIGGTFTLQNTIVAGNTANSGGPDIFGSVFSQGHNLIGATDGSAGFGSSDFTGSAASPLSAGLGTLGNYGGPTPVAPLLQGSPALGNGSSSGGPATDQRGVPRGAPIDIGAAQLLDAVVTTTNDSGPGSLRQAILDTNAHPGNDRITFAIPGGGVHIIQPLSLLPSLTDTVTIDGYSQPGSSPNTLANADNAVINIEIDGQNQNIDGLVLANVSGCVIDGLSIVRMSTFNGAGILISGSPAANVIWGNFLGLLPDGVTPAPNGDGIFVAVGADGNIIGGMTPADRNLLSGNANWGFELQGSNNTVAGNFVGVGADGQSAVGNVGGGLIDSGSRNNIVGGTGAGQGNIIQNNVGPGVQVDGSSATGNAIEGNSIFNNGSPGISLTNGANNSAIEPAPVLAYAFSAAGSTTVSGSLRSLASTVFRIEFFASSSKDPSGAGQGETFLGFTTVITDAGGNATFTFSGSPAVAVGQFMSATVTDAGNNTSQFAQDVLVTGPTSQLVLTGLPSVTTAGLALTFTVTAEDSAGNVTPQYTITVHFSSSDSQAAFPLNDVTLTNGVGSFSVTLYNAGSQSISATDSANSLMITDLITINPALSITPAPGGEIGLLYNTVLTLSGGTTPYTTFQVNNFNDGGTGLAAPSVGTTTVSFDSTPTAAGMATFSVTVTDTAGASLTQSYSVNIYPPLSLSATNPSNGTLGSQYTYAFQAGGGDGAYTYSLIPTSFAGLTLSAGGVLSGTPTAGGSFPFTVQVSDTDQPTFPAVTQNYTLVVLPTVSLSASGNPFSENGGQAVVTAKLNGISSQTVTIPLTFGGTAPGGDYTASTSSIIIPAGKTTGSITLTGANSPTFGTAPATVTVSLGTLTNGLAGSPAAVSLTIKPDPNATYVANCYQLLLGRTPDAAGFRFWVSLLTGGTAPSAVVQGFEATPEFQKDLVQALYIRYLGRPADASGLAYWSSLLASGVSLEQVTASILAAPEYLAIHRLAPVQGQSVNLGFVQGLYQQVLGRPGSSAEWSSWTKPLDSSSLTPGQITLAFLTSPEYQTDLVNGGSFHYVPMWQGFYPEFLHRAVDPTGLAAWVAALRNGMTDQAVLAGILGSAEGYHNWS